MPFLIALRVRVSCTHIVSAFFDHWKETNLGKVSSNRSLGEGREKLCVGSALSDGTRWSFMLLYCQPFPISRMFALLKVGSSRS